MLKAVLVMVVLFALLMVSSSFASSPRGANGRVIDDRFDVKFLHQVPASSDVDDVYNGLRSATEVLHKVRMDALFCAPLHHIDNKNEGEILVTEAGAFSDETNRVFGDVVREAPTPVYVENRLLTQLKVITGHVRKSLSRIMVDIQVPDSDGARFDYVRTQRSVTRGAVAIDRQLMQMQTDLVVACAEQKERLRKLDPRLAKYTIRTQNVHDVETLPRYEYGQSLYVTPRLNNDIKLPAWNQSTEKSVQNPVLLTDVNAQPAQDAFKLL